VAVEEQNEPAGLACAGPIGVVIVGSYFWQMQLQPLVQSWQQSLSLQQPLAQLVAAEVVAANASMLVLRRTAVARDKIALVNMTCPFRRPQLQLFQPPRDTLGFLSHEVSDGEQGAGCGQRISVARACRATSGEWSVGAGVLLSGRDRRAVVLFLAANPSRAGRGTATGRSSGVRARRGPCSAAV
jgi:hypothetical protein